MKLNRYAAKNSAKTAMDSLTYDFATSMPNNRLRFVKDAVTSGIFSTDFDNMLNLSKGFEYDSDGRLVTDKKEQMGIAWYPFDKPSYILDTFVPTSGPIIIKETRYGYDALHQRVEKIDVNNNQRSA